MPRNQITDVLAEIGRPGETDRSVLDRLVPLVYDELRAMARAQLFGEGRRFTLDTTGLVHEAYVKLVDAERAPVKSRGYFFGAAARAMRQVLVDAARRRNRDKRGGGQPAAELDEEAVAIDELAEELEHLDEALSRLAVDHPRPARAVECRYFGGLSIRETAEALNVAERSVKRDVAFAVAWLRRELGEAAMHLTSHDGHVVESS
ncbi:MAG: ECF-type sigma factor [Thermoanaerobaculia bacterium]|nr:ECF-type sigma factor [Thermoanaerobaculia bacterium]